MPDIYSFKAVQIIPATLEEAWDFFCTPSNLLKITPAHLNFKVINKPVEEKIYAGQIIEYKLQPVRGISVYWMTEITQVKENEYFIDEQRKGPFSLWSHRHDFRYINGSVEMTDTVQYKIPLGLLGDIAHMLFVKRLVKKIFAFRYRAVEERFKK